VDRILYYRATPKWWSVVQVVRQIGAALCLTVLFYSVNTVAFSYDATEAVLLEFDETCL
jgi:hypothetical protein